MRKIIFIAAGEPDAPSRYRAKQYFLKIKEEFGQVFIVEYFTIYPKSVDIKKNRILFLILSFFRKIFSIYKCKDYEVVFLQRNPIKILSPYYESFLKFVMKKQIVFDFDDNLWYLEGKYDNRIDKILNISDLVIVGNQYLFKKSKMFNKNTFLVNTVVDTSKIVPNFILMKKKEKNINICWTGSLPGNQYLLRLEQVFLKLKKKYSNKINFLFVSNEKPNFEFFDDYSYYDWSIEIEKKILSFSDIGIMPLLGSEIAKGKCGFKIILYGAYGITSVVSPVGANLDIIQEDENGFFAETENEWISKLSYLIDNPVVLLKFKKISREIVEKRFSLESTFNKFLELISSVFSDN